MNPPVYKRLAKIVFKYWYILIASTIAAVFFVLLNSLSIWLTASLLNNIFTDFSSVIEEQKKWAVSNSLSINDTLKYLSNKIILKESQIDSLKQLCLFLFGTFLFKNIFLYIKNILVSYVQFSLIVKIRKDLYKHIHTLSMGFFDKKKSGELTSILMNDVALMQTAFTKTFQNLIVEPINILSFCFLLFVINWKLACAAILILPFAAILYINVGNSIRRKTKRIQENIANIMHHLTETLFSIRVIKAFAAQRYEISRFSKESHNFFRLTMQRAKLDNLATPINEMIGASIGVALLWYGGLQVIQTSIMTSEDFLRFILLLFAMLVPIRNLGAVNIAIQNSLAAAERVFSILDVRSEINDSEKAKIITTLNSKINFDNVSFDYDNKKDMVLSDISFSISKGSIVALVGSSGAGKSTIADLIPRFYDVTEGSISIDGEDIKNIKIESLRKMMGIVSQEVILFNDSILNNISYGQKMINKNKIISALKTANAMEYIDKLPNGLDTIIGERGVRLSGGQKQRLSIARAIIKNPPILILDEATSSLDTESEKLVQQAIEKLMKDRTVLVIAHRLSTVKYSDEIIVLDKGIIVERGSHDKLLSKNGKYSELYNIQFQKN